MHIAQWRGPRLPDEAGVLSSPANRTVQTAQSLADRFRVLRELAPGADVAAVLAAVDWPDGMAETVIVVGHQPTLSRVAALLLSGEEANWSIQKSGIGWWANRRRDKQQAQGVLRAVVNPDLV
ncbi:histidine phosphatase family protein [Mycetohabitans sp. B8]|uniref:SixA phosphatase family protein n=1 Tax=Mycetohabitans sp. B8 TaxID=2841845 RepID=UPI001F47CA60|nr:histidine phosphatase family protein [Mycetohabitans sp. B8]